MPNRTFYVFLLLLALGCSETVSPIQEKKTEDKSNLTQKVPGEKKDTNNATEITETPVKKADREIELLNFPMDISVTIIRLLLKGEIKFPDPDFSPNPPPTVAELQDSSFKDEVKKKEGDLRVLTKRITDLIATVRKKIPDGDRSLQIKREKGITIVDNDLRKLISTIITAVSIIVSYPTFDSRYQDVPLSFWDACNELINVLKKEKVLTYLPEQKTR